MKEDQFEQIITSLEWLVGNEEPDSKQIAEVLLPKAANYLLPISEGIEIRRRYAWLENIPFLETLAWSALFALRKIRNKDSDRPKTMEIDFDWNIDRTGFSNKPSINQRGVLCLFSMQSYASMIVEIAKSLKSNNQNVSVLAPAAANGWGAFQNKIDDVGFYNIETFLSTEVKKKYLEEIDEGKNNWAPKMKEIMANGPAELRDCIKIDPTAVKYLSTEVIPQIIEIKKIAQSTLLFLNPTVLVITRLKRIVENVFAREAQLQGIPIILANHGHVGIDWDVQDLGAVDSVCSRITAWNEGQKKVWATLFPNIDEQSIVVSGGVMWDRVIRLFRSKGSDEKQRIRKHIVKALGAQGEIVPNISKKWIVITVDGYLEPSLSAIINKIKEVDGIDVLIKIRPHNKKEEYSLYAYSTAIISENMNVDLHELLFACDLCITTVSTTNLDALSVGTPVLTITVDDTSRSIDRYIYLEQFGLPLVDDVASLSKVLYQWTTDKEIAEYWKTATDKAAREYIANYPEGNAGQMFNKMIDLLVTEKCRP